MSSTSRRTKSLKIKFNFEIEVVAGVEYDNDWIADQFLDKGRFSVLRFPGEPAMVLTASSGVESVTQIGDAR